MAAHVPLIGITACVEDPIPGELSERTHRVGDSYIAAVARVAGGLPLLIPAMPDAIDIWRAAEELYEEGKERGHLR